jgi:hypothetical protein
MKPKNAHEPLKKGVINKLVKKPNIIDAVLVAELNQSYKALPVGCGGVEYVRFVPEKLISYKL